MLTLLCAIASAATVAVLPFDEGAAPDELEGFGHALSAMVMTDFTKIDGVTVVERERLDAILAELDLSKTEFVDKRTALSMGRGLAADHVVTGTYTVVNDELSIDARIVHVETGKLVKADRASGPLTDFVTVEKDVIDLLVTDLDLTLSGKSRRDVMGAASTESLDAFSAYGKGLLAGRSGDEDGAKAAFTTAVALDPNFEEAKQALVRLGRKVEAAVEAREAAKVDAKVLAQEKTLSKTIDERTRNESFRHDDDSMGAWLLRLHTLKRTEQHCVRYEEMLAYLEREGLPQKRYDWLDVEESTARHGLEWGAWTPEYPDWADRYKPIDNPRDRPLPDRGFTGRIGDLNRTVSSPDGFLWDISSWDGDPASMEDSDGLLGSLHNCFEGAEEVDALARVTERVEGDPALTKVHGGSREHEVYTVGMALRTHLASTRAWKQGLTPEDEAHAEALLALAATAPHSDEEFYIQGRAKRIQQYGERWVREQEALVEEAEAAALSEKKRLGYSEEALVGILRAFVDQDTDLLDLSDPMCQAALQAKQTTAQHRLDQLADAAEDGRDPRWIYDELWSVTASPKAVGCFRGEEGEFDSIDALYAFIDGVDLPEEPSRDCRGTVRTFRDTYQNATNRMDPTQFPIPAAMYALSALDAYYRIEFDGCLAD